jgi:uncharacterized protein DUF3179
MGPRGRLVAAILAGAVLLTGLVVIARHQSRMQHDQAAVREHGAPALDPIRPNEIVSVLPQDAIPALIKPSYLAASQASDINPQEEVIGVVINGDARAYPLLTLNVHEIVDDDVGGQPIAVTW